jgi:8-oxo-dGTP pyrophosphatase MutT (NUDIX family)
MAEQMDMRTRIRLLESGQLAPMVPRPASTVAVVRDGADGLEVYLLRRVPRMSFGAGMHVFPGGSVDPADADVPVGPVADLAGRFGVEEGLARQLVVAAIRETFEEAGVLLAAKADGELLADVGADPWEAEREALEARQTTLGAVLDQHDLVLRTDLLAPLAHWITPEAEARRFDTYFFLAAQPAGQDCREAGTEADARLWIRPADAISQGLALMPPTRATLTELARYPDVAAALAAEREIPVLQPSFALVDDEVVFHGPEV